MALRTIITEGDPVLNKVCRPVEKFDDRLHILIDDMKETLAVSLEYADAADKYDLNGHKTGIAVERK